MTTEITIRKLIFFLFAFLILVHSRSMARELSCREFYGFDSQQAWLAYEAAIARDYARNSPQEKTIAKILLEANQKSKDLVTPLEGPGFTVSIIDQGLGRHNKEDPRKAVQVIFTDSATQEKTVILSSLNYGGAPVIKTFRNNNTTIPVSIQLSPKRDILLVKMSAKGSIDEHTLVVIDIASKKIISEIEFADAGAPIWISSKTFVYRKRLENRPSFRVDIIKGKVAEEPIKIGGIRASTDQQWLYYSKSEPAETVLINVVSQKKTILPKLSIDEIFKTDVENGVLWIKTEGAAGFKELVRVKLRGDSYELKTLVPEGKMVLDDIEVEKDHLVVSKYLGANRQIDFLNLDGKILDQIKAPDCCAILYSKYDTTTRIAELTMQSPVHRRMVWKHDFKTKDWLQEQENKEYKTAKPEVAMMLVGNETFVTENKTVISKDGTEIPMRITYKEATVFDGNAPTLMEGYGGFASNNYFHPEYARMTHEFIRAGGVHLAPALRGSYYFGAKWHEMGRAQHKQNVIDDFIAAAEWAIQNKITRPKRLAISGASHGGFVVAAALVQRPDLFGIGFPQYGPLAFDQKPELDPLTVKLQVQEYGDLVGDIGAIANAQNISPARNLIPQDYPMIFLIEGRNDTRVNPEHSNRFYRKLKQNQLGSAKSYLYTLPNSGHWMTSIARQDLIGWRSTVTMWATLFKYMNMDVEQ